MLFTGASLCSAQYAQGRFGVGFIVGEPTGVAVKYRIGQSNAVDGAIGISPYNQFRIHADYLWQSHPFHEQGLGLHYGAGAAFGTGRTNYVYSPNVGYFRTHEIGFGLRGVLGMNYLIRNAPLDLFLEAAPIIVIAPGSDFGVDLGFGARVYF
jgi:hypothetical protein